MTIPKTCQSKSKDHAPDWCFQCLQAEIERLKEALKISKEKNDTLIRELQKYEPEGIPFLRLNENVH